MDLAEQYRRQRRWRRWERVYDHLGDLAGQCVLDLGCGIGDQAADLAARGARITGIDNNAELVELARSRQIPEARFVEMNLCEPAPLPGVRADGLWLGFSAAYFPDLGVVLDGWMPWLRPGGWIAITEVDDLLGHEPLEPRWQRAVESFYSDARARGAYEFRSQERVREALVARRWGIEVEADVPDAELSAQGPAAPEIVEAWRLRLERMGGLKAHLGTDAEAFREAFLDCLRAERHRSHARVWFLLARRRSE